MARSTPVKCGMVGRRWWYGSDGAASASIGNGDFGGVGEASGCGVASAIFSSGGVAVVVTVDDGDGGVCGGGP
ncbi:Hypothetical predicted protein [Olea europaea subsp. europaea]|uniref:Uncharacterized protein n=1 Tax=Olea europaea subsp. europaea TaxID=158383 RepID=A0A8S0RL02_OLEEU|nr:Hypothetical predicted protein [Olea europaea subsp. europaea]